ncbi:MAG TPA: hypothetical protein VMD98_09390 [Bryocella sp.]|nr:hypothetical protein [Bryocella sp.]
MNKLLTAIAAALMIAGGLGAISGATPLPSRDAVVVVGEGSSPSPVLVSADTARGDAGFTVNP